MSGFDNDAAGPWINKDPDAVLDYAVDWSASGSSWLGTDTISAVTWIVPSGITLASSTHTSTVATIWLSGGTSGQTYNITCRITTVGGRQEDRSFRVIVKDR